MEVTRRDGNRLQTACFICDARIGRGMDFSGFTAPLGMAPPPPKSIADWNRLHGRKAS